MNFFRRLIEFIMGFAAVLGILFLVATTYGWDKIWERFVGSPDMGAVQFESLSKGPKPNQTLICPDGLCKDDDRDATSPVYALKVEDLREKLMASLKNEQSLERVDDDSDPTALRYVQRSRLMRFPDTIRIKLIALEGDTSTLALYSQSQLGHSDLGANKKRADRWLARLSEFEQSDIIKPAE